MKSISMRYGVLSLLMVLMAIGNSVYSAKSEKEEEREQEAKRFHKPAKWPKQKITHEVRSINPMHVVNFQHLADSMTAAPKPPRNGFIGQIEDKDADFRFTPHHIPANTPVFDPDQVPGRRAREEDGAVHQPLSPAPLGYFLGTTGNGSEVPPDVDGAAGPTYVLETNNQQYDIFTKAGTLAMTLDINVFWAATGGNGFYDPHVLYDNIHNRFILVSDGFFGANGVNPGGVFVAVSLTSDPTGDWYEYSINDGDNVAADLLDYPQVGYNQNWVVVTFNDFVGNNVTDDIYVFNRDSLYNGGLGTTHLFTDNNAFSWGPAQTYDTTTLTEWMVQDGNGAQGAMQIGSITGTANAPAYNAGSNISVTSKWNENSVDVYQKGGTASTLINDDDTRIGNGSVLLNGKLWFTHAIWLPATGTATNAGVDWWQITPSTLTLNQFGRIAAPTNGTAVTNYYYPSLNVNMNGDALLGYCISSLDSFYPSAAYSFHASTDAANTMEPRYIYKNGAATYYQTLGGNRNRYGDFTGTSVDPVDGSFWNYSEWAYSATIWGIVIAHVPPSTAYTLAPVAYFLDSFNTSSCNGVINFQDQSANSPTSWLWNFGDGSATSTLQNPIHQYTTNGTYLVTFTATNTHGSSTYKADVTISMPVGPTVSNVSNCGPVSFSLPAGTTNPVAWFDSAGVQVSGANPFVTPVLTQTTTYYVQDTVPSPVDSVGPVAYTTLGTNSTFANTNQHFETFDALSDFTLVSVTVRASTTGSRTIQLINSLGTVLASVNTPSLVVGTNVVTLNFKVPKGYEYGLACGGTGTTNIDLYRNNAVAAGAYPFTLPGVLSITGSDEGTGYYYFFYDWKVQESSCVSEQTKVIASIYPKVTATITATAVACYGGATGSVIADITGGTSAFTYHWSPATQTTDTITGLAAGTYDVTVTDAHSCSATAQAIISQPVAALSVSGTQTNPTCSASGSVDLTVSGGTTTYTYSWNTNPVQTTIDATNLGAGSYTVTVTDAHHCTATKAFTLTGGAGSFTLTPSSTPTSCSSNTGTATVTPSAAGTYTYAWTGSASTTNTASGLAVGTYTVTATSSGCSATASIQVTSAGAPTLTPSSTATTCGENNGSVSVTVANPSSPTYTWSGGLGTTASITGTVPSGTYTVTVVNAGCTGTTTVVVGGSSAPSLTPSSAATTCGENNGSVSVTVANPSNPSYSWSGGLGSTASISGTVPSGSYTVTVTNDGCTATTTVSVAASTALSLSTSSTATSCGGGSNGSASVSFNVASVNPTYHWNTNATTSTITGLTAGPYQVTVTNNGCSATATVSVAAGSGSLVLQNSNVIDPQCFGETNGSASVSVSGGTPGYSYSWSTNPVQTTSTASNLAAGQYTVTVRDAAGCQSLDTVVIISPSQLIASESTTPVSCPGHTDGTATAAGSGGTPTYTYTWNTTPIQTTATATGLIAGTYDATVTDANGCSALASATVSSLSAVAATISITQPTQGNVHGTAVITGITGGTGPYTESWSNSDSGDSVTLVPGTYYVTITDAHGCDQIDTVVINKPSGINTISDGIGFSIAPNPARTEVVVSLQAGYTDATISLRDILGQNLISIPASSSEITLDLSPYTTGVYFIELSQGGRRAVKKLIIAKN